MSRHGDKGKGIASDSGDAGRKRTREADSRPSQADSLLTSLASCVVHPTRFIDWETMTRLGVKDDMEMLFGNMGLRQYMHLMEYTHADETIQFLASLRSTVDRARQVVTGIRFKIHGRSYRLTTEDVCEIYGFERFSLGEEDMGTLPGMMDLWHCTASGAYRMGKAKASNIRNPVIKLVQRSLGFAFFGRLLVGPVITEEWKMICFALRPLIAELEPPVRDIPVTDPAFLFIGNLRLMQITARTKKSTGWPLCIGGTLTPIFRHCGVELSEPLPKIPLIDMAHLRNCHFLSRSDVLAYPFTWNGRDQELVLPRPDLVSISIPANISFTHVLDDEARDEGVDAASAHVEDDTAPAHDEAPRSTTHEHGTTSHRQPLHYTRRTPMERRLAKENGILKKWVKKMAETIKSLKGHIRSLDRHTGHVFRTRQAETRTKRRHDRPTPSPPSSPSLDLATPPVSDTESDSA